ncbi:MAG TPA: DMT family transporter [Clostridia bacterium]|nr:DMT family transporter [Clostridia bacterium]
MPDAGKIEPAFKAQTDARDSNPKDLLWIHLAVALFGFSGLFAKAVHQPAGLIVLGRVLFSTVSLLVPMKTAKYPFKPESKRDLALFVLAGLVLAAHWTAFMESIRVSTVAIGVLTFSTFPVFVTFLEPYFFREKLKASNVVCALVMLAGVACIVPEFSLGNETTHGVLWGMAGSLSYAVLSLLNRRFAKRYPGIRVAFYEQCTATVALLPMLFALRPVFSTNDVMGLLALGVVFTALAHSMFVQGLKSVRAQTAGIISSLESVYGILAAALLFGEIPGTREIAGGAVIFSVVLYSTLAARKKAGA